MKDGLCSSISNNERLKGSNSRMNS